MGCVCGVTQGVLMLVCIAMMWTLLRRKNRVRNGVYSCTCGCGPCYMSVQVLYEKPLSRKFTLLVAILAPHECPSPMKNL